MARCGQLPQGGGIITDDQPEPKKPIRGYVSRYLREPLRSLREVEQQQEAEEPESESGKERQQPKG